jgi:ATP adenylyltransferase
MVGRVLANRAVVKRERGDYELLGYDRLTAEQVQELKAICDRRLAEYIARRGKAIWEHRPAKRWLHQWNSAL